jgi:hypothetical protein
MRVLLLPHRKSQKNCNNSTDKTQQYPAKKRQQIFLSSTAPEFD